DAAVLPPYKRIVFDEAHGIESAATSFFSEQVTRFKIIKQLNLLYRERRSSLAGYIFTLTALSNGPDNTEKIGEVVDRIKDNIKSLETAALDLLGNEWTLRLYEKNALAFAPLLSLLTSLGGELSRLVALVREVCDNVADEDKTENAYWETKAITRRLEDAASVCKDFSFWDEKRDQVFWMQRQRLNEEFVKDGLPFYITFSRTPLDIAPLMNTGVFEPMESVVCASATQKIAGSFDFWTRRTGLSFVEEERLKSAGFDSPFPYEKNVLFACPKDLPFPDSIEFQQYVELALIKLVKASKGRALVLFTSYDSLKSAYSTCQYELGKCGINVFKQGDDDRFRLLDKFKNDETSALFATDSFWQGIDVPGSSLSQVIIVKLPFSVPNDPVFAARAEEVERRGGSSFMELSLPEAVIKFRQGFGRLVRRSTDKGAVVVLDRRLMEKRYGRIFLDSLPRTKRLYAGLNDVCAAVEAVLE
ncbi:MAG: helicase, partial [Treponema sp.]|nr:helicase [Treponema sp.]